MEKKAQVTFYIIFAVIIILIAGSYFVLKSSEKRTAVLQDEMQAQGEIETFVDGCIKETTNAGIMKMGLQGGYIRLPEQRFSMVYSEIPYWYYHGNDVSPSLEVLQDELAYYINQNIDDCIYGFEAFKQQGYTVETGERFTSVIISDKDVVVNIDYPSTFSIGEDIRSFDSFDVRLDVRLKTIWGLSQRILANTIVDPFHVDQTRMLELMKEYDVQIDTMTYGQEGVVAYVIDDKASVLWPGTNLLFTFATKVDMTPRAPVITLQQDRFYGSVGDKISIYVTASDPNNDKLSYFTNSSSIGINKISGFIDYIPEERGVHKILVDVSDGVFVSSKVLTIYVGDAQ